MGRLQSFGWNVRNWVVSGWSAAVASSTRLFATGWALPFMSQPINAFINPNTATTPTAVLEVKQTDR